MASARSPARGQKSQHSEHPVHIFTSSGRLVATLTASEFEGQTATHVPHCTHRSVLRTAASSSQNHVLPLGSSTPFIESRIS